MDCRNFRSLGRHVLWIWLSSEGFSGVRIEKTSKKLPRPPASLRFNGIGKPLSD